MSALAFALLLIFSAIGPTAAEDRIFGVASVIDGDAVEIHGQPIRLFGIDAPRKQPALHATDERTMALWTASEPCVGR